MAVRVESQAEPIPGYRLIERLGGGGFGEVWKAEAPGGLHKAIKFVYGELDAAGDDAQRAEQELKSIRRVQSVRHPYILSLERYDIIDGQLIIVMELADKNLWDRFKECRSQGLPGIPRDELLRYMEEAAEALDLMNNTYALQHLDIKPQNLFLVHNHIKVADFGLVKDLEGMAASVTGGVTPVYAAPETFDSWVSRFSDQYSLAIVYQEMVSGQRPFSGANVRQLVLQHLQGTPDLASLAPAERPAIARALAKNPDERYPTCLELVRDLRVAGGGAPPAEGTAVAFAPPSTDGPLKGSTDDPAGSPARTPGLFATPHVVGGASQRPTDWLRAPRSTPKSAPTTGKTLRADGDGVLVPAVVVGAGGLGLAVLQRLREALGAQFGPPDVTPHLRLLYLDTDPDEVKAAARGPAGFVESLLLRLNRPSHYLKPRDGRPDVTSWLDPKMLYRIPRTLRTAGFRALGRLAFFDNYRLVAQRLRGELEACAGPEALAAADRHTRLGLRVLRPRVYVVAGLAGGTGGGLFLDLAYVARDVLRRLGHAEPEVIGLLVVPSAGRKAADPLAPGNTFAALAELSHFQGGAGFVCRYLEREPALSDRAPPFTRCVVLPQPEEAGEAGEALAQAAELVARDLLSPLGRAADTARAPLRGPPASCQTFGLYKFAFPRRELTARVARRLCAALVKRWMSKDGAAHRPSAQTFLEERWPRDQYGPETFIERLQADAEAALGTAPDAVFANLTRDLAATSLPDPVAVLDVLARLEEQLGRPGCDTLADKPSRLQEVLRDAGDRVVAEWGQHLGELVVGLIEAPEFRLAGAEEAARQVVAVLQKMLEHQEPLAKELAARAAEAHARVHGLVALLAKPAPPKGRPLPSAADFLELLRAYPKWRYQSLVLQQVSRGLVSLRGLMSDELREVNFCRARLGELLKTFEDNPGGPGEKAAGEVPGRNLLPRGCATVEQAVEEVMKDQTPEQLAALEEKMQAMICRQFTALVHVCLTPSNMLRNVETAMQQEAEAAVKGTLAWSDATELFLEQHPDETEAQAAIAAAFEEAVGELSGGEGVRELCVLSVPAGPAGDRFRELAKEALPNVDLVHVTGGDDVVFYREAVGLPVARLPQLGSAGREAYQRLSSVEHFTPHSRADVRFQIAGGE